MEKRVAWGAVLATAAFDLLTASASPATVAWSKGKSAAPKIELHGSRIITRRCGLPSPCRINKPMTHEHGWDWDYTAAVRIRQGGRGQNAPGRRHLVLAVR